MRKRLSTLVHSLAFAGLSVSAVLLSAPAQANNLPVPPDCTDQRVCTADNYKITMVRYYTWRDEGDDFKKKVTFVYQVCPGNGGNFCGLPPKDLSNVRVDLPDGDCLDNVSVEVGTDQTILDNCEIVASDDPINQPTSPNYCAIGGVALGKQIKCDVVSDWGKNNEPCTPIKVTFLYSDFMANLDIGIGAVGTKAGPDCQPATILGPVCKGSAQQCVQPE